MNKLFLISIACFIIFNEKSLGQASISGSDLVGAARPITTAVPFLTITPDARSGAMGDAGVAISPDVNSSYWNIGKLAMIDKQIGVSVSYTPWLARLVNDMSISYLTGFYKPTKEQAFSFSMKYFNLGELQQTDQNGFVVQLLRPKEYMFSLGYSRMLSEKLSIGGAGKFIYSNLTGSIQAAQGQVQPKPGISGAVDFGIYYKTDINIGAGNNSLALGATITDVGSKMTYTDATQANPIPTAIKLGTAFTTEIDPYNKMTFVLDAVKLMTPSPVYKENKDSTGRIFYTPLRTNNKGLFSGMFGSFSDAPEGFTEEMREIILCGAVEYWYNDLFAARVGYFSENKLKGNRKYVTFGFGVKYQSFGLDFAYLVPTGNRNSPLAETLRFTLHYQFEAKSKEETIVE
ncbi:MAG: hypothetical protein EAZ07_03685 [Cytophagales bacterium]|nr:MAG: hypothetical protein EAZ07_03685 [Cytophagales bacterium]